MIHVLSVMSVIVLFNFLKESENASTTFLSVFVQSEAPQDELNGQWILRICCCLFSALVVVLTIINIVWTDMTSCLCPVKPVVPRCSVPEAVTVGTSTELRCLENEGFPAPQYRWFHNNEELPQDPKNSPRFVNFSYSINPDTGSLVRDADHHNI